MRPFIKRALQKLDQLDTGMTHDFIMAASHEIDRLEIVIESIPKGILVCDNAHNLILANKAARRFLSIVSYEQARETVWSVIPDELIANFLADIIVAKDRVDEREFDTEINKSMRVLSISVMPLAHEWQVLGSLILVDDITERKVREAAMRRTENLASLTNLAAGVAHEIKNPLGALSIHVQLIQKILDANRNKEADSEHHTDQIDKYLNVINEEVERLNAIVVDFLFAVRPMNTALRKGNINDFIKDLVSFLSPELEASSIEVILNLGDNLPSLDFDPGLMKVALLNLIKNAEAAMSGGGKLNITTEKEEGEVLIGVADTGAGIPDEIFPKIFDPYTTTKKDGTGLGLTLVFKIVKEHHGEINVVTSKGEGSVFTIALPIPQVGRPLLTFEDSLSAAPETDLPTGRVK